VAVAAGLTPTSGDGYCGLEGIWISKGASFSPRRGARGAYMGDGEAVAKEIDDGRPSFGGGLVQVAARVEEGRDVGARLSKGGEAEALPRPL
jgi:hypothetical protein